ncbi:MAG: hypothetical protein LBL86_07135 [Coriobacteriales bacterium]|jgi:phi13 family phage major tail protein|nr:hypothetical protein [Coriobacteriales bacterium]
MAANKIRYGLRNAHYAVLDEEGGTYATPVKLPGAVSLELTPEGEESSFYADDAKYFTMTANNGYKGSLELAYIDDAAKAALLGFGTDDNGLALEGPDDVQAPFALLYEVQGDAAGRRYVFYNVKMARPAESRETQGEQTTPKTESASISALPFTFDGRRVVKASLEYATATATAYDAWFSAVAVPETVAQG